MHHQNRQQRDRLNSTAERFAFGAACPLVLALALTLSACVPIPNREYFAPAVRGRVVNAGEPMQNVELRLSSPFTHSASVVSTDSDGRFTIATLRVWRLSTWLLGDPLHDYSLWIRTAGSEYPGLSEAGVGYAPTQLRIFCDLSKQVRSGGTSVYCTRDGNDVNP